MTWAVDITRFFSSKKRNHHHDEVIAPDYLDEAELVIHNDGRKQYVWKSGYQLECPLQFCF